MVLALSGILNLLVEGLVLTKKKKKNMPAQLCLGQISWSSVFSFWKLIKFAREQVIGPPFFF